MSIFVWTCLPLSDRVRLYFAQFPGLLNRLVSKARLLLVDVSCQQTSVFMTVCDRCPENWFMAVIELLLTSVASYLVTVWWTVISVKVQGRSVLLQDENNEFYLIYVTFFCAGLIEYKFKYKILNLTFTIIVCHWLTM